LFPTDFPIDKKKRLRLPRVAEVVAEGLRARIMSGALADGAMLPKQSDLLAEFGVTLPAIREAFSILETEGLITVRRGNVGGAVVHRPQPSKAAYMLGLVMQANAVRLEHVMDAIRYLESRLAPPRAPAIPTVRKRSFRGCARLSTNPTRRSTIPSVISALPCNSISSWLRVAGIRQ
jgi:DNA-binding GntR family transcriptional regulator